MQQLQQPKKQEQKPKVKEDMREMKGRHLATSRNIYRLQNSDTFYVESESSNDIYYYVRYNPDVIEWCSCPDQSKRGTKCKHIFAIEFSIMKGTLKEVDRLPKEAIRDNQLPKEQHEQLEANEVIEAISFNSYREDEYSF
jgi:predicted nucleic acid-binding Zn finger protein